MPKRTSSFIKHQRVQAFPDSEAILFIRGQRDLIFSLYNQYIKRMRFAGELIENFITPNRDEIRFSELSRGQSELDIQALYYSTECIMNADDFLYGSMIELYRKCFKKVHVFLYEDFSKDPHGVIDRLSNLLEVSIPETVMSRLSAERSNLRLDNSELWTAMYYNRLSCLSGKSAFTGIARISSFFSKMHGKGLEERMNSYLDSFVDSAGYGPNNREANEVYSLGMERYPEQYFFKC